MRRLTLFFLVLSSGLKAQDTLSLDQAIAIALERNFDVRIAQNDTEIAHLNNTRANAGLLPTVNLNAGDNVSALNFRQKLANGTEINRPLGIFNTFATSLNAAWTLYDGRHAYMEKDKLDALDAQGRDLLQAQMKQTATDVALAWYDAARIQETIRNLDEVIATFRERLNLASNRLEFGLGNKSDMLQAQIDLNERLKQKNAGRKRFDGGQTQLKQHPHPRPGNQFHTGEAALGFARPTRYCGIKTGNLCAKSFRNST